MLCESRGTQGLSSSSKLIEEKKESWIASTQGGVREFAVGMETLETGADDS